ncbi:MAG: hypothetical protein AAFO07_29010 [Bacteroidota bacterium]
MRLFPKFKKLSDAQVLGYYASTYEKNSGLAVPMDYLKNNHVFGIHYQGKMIGGFILGSGGHLRTIEFFAAKEKHEALYQQMDSVDTYTEICCFWIDKAFRKRTFINYFTWVAMAYSLKKWGTKNIIFGTNSIRLAALYATTPKSIPLHKDKVNKKRTFIFVAKKKGSMKGILEIVYHKFVRLIKVKLSKTKSVRSFRSEKIKIRA